MPQVDPNHDLSKSIDRCTIQTVEKKIIIWILSLTYNVSLTSNDHKIRQKKSSLINTFSLMPIDLTVYC